MAAITSREDFKNYCLRRLGFPVIDINVDDDQVEDRVDDALQYWQDYHFDGLQKFYYIRRLTTSILTANTNISSFVPNMVTVLGGTSNATAKIMSSPNNTTLELKEVSGKFTVGEVLKYYAANGTVQTTNTTIQAYTSGDIDNRYIDLRSVVDQEGIPLNVVGVSRIFPIQDSQATVNMFDLRYQLRLNELYDFTSASYINYTMTQQHLRMLEQLFSGEVPIRFQRHMQRLYIDWGWGKNADAVKSTVVIAECYATINSDYYTQVWNDRWLKEYATALIKRSWGNNMKKFGGLMLPGGVTLNGADVYNEAVEEIKQLEAEMENNYGGVLEFYLN
jgi:hypothetical protein